MAGRNDIAERMAERESGAAGRSGLPDRFHWLDFLRFLAAIAVVTHHYYLFYMQGLERTVDEGTMIAMFPFPQMTFFYDYGQYAVQFFWVLSGFVFAHTYFRRPTDGFGFAVARFARLYPLHFATLLIVAALQVASIGLLGTAQVADGNDVAHFAIQLFLGSGWAPMDHYGFNVPTWSVSAEIGAYVLFFVFHRSPWFRTACGQAAAMLAAMLAASVYDAAVPVCAAFFFAGGLAYTLVERRRLADFVLVVPLVLLARRFPESLTLLSTPMAVPLAAFALLVFAVAWLDVFRVPGGRIAGHLGDITYASYLLHFPVILATLVALDLAGIADRMVFSYPETFAAYIASVALLSISCYRFYERPADRAIRAWAHRLKATGMETAPATRAA